MRLLQDCRLARHETLIPVKQQMRILKQFNNTKLSSSNWRCVTRGRDWVEKSAQFGRVGPRTVSFTQTERVITPDIGLNCKNREPTLVFFLLSSPSQKLFFTCIPSPILPHLDLRKDYLRSKVVYKDVWLKEFGEIKRKYCTSLSNWNHMWFRTIVTQLPGTYSALLILSLFIFTLHCNSTTNQIYHLTRGPYTRHDMIKKYTGKK